MSTVTAPELIHVGQIELQFIATAEQTGGALSVFTATVPPGAMTPPSHFHEGVQEVVYGLEGTLTFYVDGVAHEIETGTSVIVPGGVEHSFKNLHDVTARVLTVQTPGKIGPDFYRETGAILGAGGPPDVAKLIATMAHHGLVAVPPRS